MKILEKNGLDIEFGRKFKKLKENEHFIYKCGDDESFAIKVNDEYAILITADNTFVCARAYRNCLYTGSRMSIEHSTLDEAMESCKKHIDELSNRNPSKRDHIR